MALGFVHAYSSKVVHYAVNGAQTLNRKTSNQSWLYSQVIVFDAVNSSNPAQIFGVPKKIPAGNLQFLMNS
jgi:hypothetical protein